MLDETPIPQAVDARELLKSTGKLSLPEQESVAQNMTPFQTILLGVVRDLGNDVRRIFVRLDNQDRNISDLGTGVGEVKTLQRTTNGRMLANETAIDTLTTQQKLNTIRKTEEAEAKVIAAKAVADATRGRVSFPMPSKTQIYYIGGILAFVGSDRILNAFTFLWRFAKAHF